MKKLVCEFIGTLCLVLFGCGVAVLTNADIVTTALAFGLTIVTLAYVIGNISGCHVNPAVSFAMFLDRRISGKEFIRYVVAQILGALVGALLLALILNSVGNIGDYTATSLGTNSYGGFGAKMFGAFVAEIIMTFFFVFTVLGVTKDKEKSNVAGIVIGLALVFVHLLGIRLTGTSVNPARSLGPALVKGGKALKQVWLFILAPMVGAGFAATLYRYLYNDKKTKRKHK